MWELRVSYAHSALHSLHHHLILRSLIDVLLGHHGIKASLRVKEDIVRHGLSEHAPGVSLDDIGILLQLDAVDVSLQNVSHLKFLLINHREGLVQVVVSVRHI